MYERNAIVLERYFEKILKCEQDSNLKLLYENYSKLIENLENYNLAIMSEDVANNEFEKVSNTIKKIQKSRRKTL